MPGLYLHIPFCKKACHYCNFHFSTSLQNKSAIVDSIIKEIELQHDYLPKEIFDRPKWGFGLPIRTWLRKEMRFLVDKYLNEATIDKYGLFNVSEISRIKEKYLAGSDAEFNKVWMLMCLIMWLEKNQHTYE